MKKMALLMMLGIVLGCSTDRSRSVLTAPNEIHVEDSSVFPKFIDEGTKVVYQYGHLTADKGLKLYLDTIPYPAGGLKLDDSIRERLSVE